MQKIFFLSCFLIISSCDLPNEANKDCNGIQGGSAERDDCGVCSGGETGLEPNANKDLCGECFGENDCEAPQCSDPLAINYYENAENPNDDLCIYDLCTDYIESNDNCSHETNDSPPYNIGDQLGCETLETSFDICYPEDCGTIKLADFENKVIFIIYEQDWWVSCYNSIPQLEEDIILHYLDDPNVAIINILSDEPGGLSCEVWGLEGDDRVPIIVNDYNYDGIFGDWFGIGSWSSPWFFIIDDTSNDEDQNFVYKGKTQSESEAEDLLENILNLE